MRSLVLDVVDWAALLAADSSVEQWGAAADVAVIPAQHRRRLPAFARDAARCALPLLEAAPGADLVFAAPYGDLETTVTLLTNIAQSELLSPTQFSLSVHNAPAGVIGLCLENAGDHTAIAAGQDSFAAGLTEAYTRLVTQDSEAVVFVYAEARLPEIYAGLDRDDAPGVVVALTLRLVGASHDREITVGAGRAGATDVVHALQRGERRLRFAPPALADAA